MATCPLDGLTGRYGTILIDPPWRFANRTGKVAPEHKRLRRYPTLSFEEIGGLPLADRALPQSHLYLWCPNALLLEGLNIMKGWGVHVQNEYRLVQSPKGRWTRRPRGRILLPQRDRVAPVRNSRKVANAKTRPDAGQHYLHPQARAFVEAEGSLRRHRSVQSRAVSRIVRSSVSPGVEVVGRSGRDL